MKTIYADELGKCFAKRNNLAIYKEPRNEMLAVYSIVKEVLWDSEGNYIGLGDRLEAVRIGYVSNIENAEHAFDAAQAELAALAGE